MPKHKVAAVCVYCGSGNGSDPDYATAARDLGEAFAEAGIRLVYGAGSRGLMGEIGRATLQAGGQVTGIIPESLVDQELPLKELDELIITQNLHERKMLMYKRADAFVALPGGIGTLEELVEQLTWVQLRHHDKPVVIANIKDYWRPFFGLLDQMRAQQFIRGGLEPSYRIVERVEAIVPLLQGISVGDHPPALDHFA